VDEERRVIIDPDFLDHWRTRMVVDALGGDEMAPMFIMRLWAHCQARKSDRHAMPPAGLKAQCRAPHDAVAFEQALTDAGFVQREGDTILVLGWAEQNASLLAAWENGAKGGRPSKQPKQNPRVTGSEPTGNPAVTHGEPNANPDETDKSREEKNSSSLRSEEQRATRLPKPFALPDDWRQFCRAERPELDPDRVAAKFADYWHGVSGKGGRKLDWLATWRNWVRDERAPARAITAAPAAQSFAAQDREAGMRRWEEMTGRTHPDRAGQPACLVIDQPPLSLGAPA
jgi:hypothetical protein